MIEIKKIVEFMRSGEFWVSYDHIEEKCREEIVARLEELDKSKAKKSDLEITREAVRKFQEACMGLMSLSKIKEPNVIKTMGKLPINRGLKMETNLRQLEVLTRAWNTLSNMCIRDDKLRKKKSIVFNKLTEQLLEKVDLCLKSG